MMKKLILIILLFNTYIAAQEIQYSFDQVKVEDGLSQTTIQSILQDQKGYMWFGTGNGLNRFDGYKFVVYSNNPNDPTSISSNSVTSVFEDKNGFIWIGTVSGILNKFDRNSETFIHFDISASLAVEENPTDYYEYPISFSRNNNNSITTIVEDNDNNLWIGTWGKGLIVLNKITGRRSHYTFKNGAGESLSYNRIMEIIKDREGTIWIATFGGGLNKAVKYNDGFIFEKYLHGNNLNSISDNRILSILEDKQENLWIGTYSGGISMLRKDQKKLNATDAGFEIFKHNEKVNSLSNNIVMAILEDRLGYIWIGTFGGGLDRYDRDKKHFTNFKNIPFDENSIADNEVLSLYEDRAGIIWIGMHLGSGISKLERNKVKFNKLKYIPGVENGLSDDVIWSVYKDLNNYIWLGTYRSGLNKYDTKRGKFSHYTTKNSDISGDHIRAITEDKEGNLWIGTYNKGLNKLNKATGRFTVYNANPDDSNSITANQIQSIYIDKEDIMWVGTFGGGLNYADLKSTPLKFRVYKNNPNDKTSISDNRVYTIYEDSKGILWIGTFGGGLNKFDRNKKTFERFQKLEKDPNSLSNDRVMCIYEDSKKQLWVGTFGGSLNKFNTGTKTFTKYYGNSLINNDVVYGILEDDNKNLWLSTNNGLFKLNIETEKVTQYELEDGIQDLEYSGGAFFKSQDGEMLFGGIKGLNYFHPKNIYENKFVPPVVITSIKVFNNEVKGERKELELEYYENFLTFEFAALDFSNPKNNNYKYKLEGLDDEWHYGDPAIRMANYTNLSPGTYIFKVIGSNSDATWNNEGAEIKIVIKSPIWKTWWFIGGGVILLAIILYYLSTVRIKNQLAIEKLKAKLAADLHDNIGSGLTEISILSEVVKNTIPAENISAQNNLRCISEEARILVDNMSDIVWVVNPKRDSLHDLILRIKDIYSDLLQQLDISFKIRGLEKIANIKLPMEYKQNLFLIFKEGINNCIKHSKCKRIVLDVNLENDILEITLSDDGVGIPESNENFGNGIRNIKNRTDLMGGNITIETKKGEGVSIKYRGKISRLSRLKKYFNRV